MFLCIALSRLAALLVLPVFAIRLPVANPPVAQQKIFRRQSHKIFEACNGLQKLYFLFIFN